MELHELPKISARSGKRLGQGHGSGRGKTGGRGQKGQKVRNTVPLFFEGGALPLRKRLPMLRGKDRNKVFKKQPVAINVDALNSLAKGTTVNAELLVQNKIVDSIATSQGVKILGNGELTVSLTVQLPVSKGAREKIEKAGGTVVV